jgi:hypothetical protein
VTLKEAAMSKIISRREANSMSSANPASPSYDARKYGTRGAQLSPDAYEFLYGRQLRNTAPLPACYSEREAARVAEYHRSGNAPVENYVLNEGRSAHRRLLGR